MASALEVAKYIVQESLDRNSPVSNLKLQKLLYFVQGSSLAVNGMPAFDDEIVAWKYGPVVENVYYTYSMYGANDIIPPCEEEVTLSSNLKSIIDFVLSSLLPLSAIELVNETHKYNSPWDRVDMYDVIDIDSIKTYFLEHYYKIKGSENEWFT